jgi:putative ABC transport system substrate-binding protein
MKKIVSLIISLLICISVSFFIFYRRTAVQGNLVAIFVPAKHPAMDEIVTGFCNSFKERMPLMQFRVYNGQGNKTLMQSQAEMIVSSNADLVFTIGNLTSQLIRTALSKRGSQMPHVFTAVDDPVEKKLVYSLTSPGNRTTGVISLSHFDEQIAYLLMVKPTIKSVLLAYDPTHPSNGADIEKLEQLLKEKQVRLVLCPINQTSEIGQKVAPMLNDVDAVLILKDHLLVMGVELLARLCEQRRIPLYCSDLNSADKGAALAFGIHEQEYGTAAESLAYQIIVEKKDAGSIPIKEITNLHFKIKRSAIVNQGIELTDEQ